MYEDKIKKFKNQKKRIVGGTGYQNFKFEKMTIKTYTKNENKYV